MGIADMIGIITVFIDMRGVSTTVVSDVVSVVRGGSTEVMMGASLEMNAKSKFEG